MIPSDIYQQILEYSIISAVDAIVVYKDKVLLGKRTQEPCKGMWWIPGGRQNKGEMPQDAIIRKIKSEIGIDVTVERFVGVYDAIFDKTAFPNLKTGVHYVARVYVVKPIGDNFEIRLDETQKEYKWIDSIDNDLHNYVKTALKDSRIFQTKRLV